MATSDPDPRHAGPRARHRRRAHRRRCLARGPRGRVRRHHRPERRRQDDALQPALGAAAADGRARSSSRPRRHRRAAVPAHARRARPDVPGLERLPAAVACTRTCASPRRPRSAARCGSGGGRPRCARRRAGATGRSSASASRARLLWPAGLLSHGDKRKLELAMLLAGDPDGDPARRADGGRLGRGRRRARRADPAPCTARRARRC